MDESTDMNMRVRSLLASLAAEGVQPCGVADDSRAVQRGVFLLTLGPRPMGVDSSAMRWRERGCGVMGGRGGGIRLEPRVAVRPLRSVRFAPPRGAACACSLWLAVRAAVSVALTGTNGKTTVSQWLGRAHPRRCATIGDWELALSMPSRMAC